MLFVMGVGFLLDSPLIVFHSMCVFRLWSQCPSRCSFHMPDLCVCMAWLMSLFKCSSLLSVGSFALIMSRSFICALMFSGNRGLLGTKLSHPSLLQLDDGKMDRKGGEETKPASAVCHMLSLMLAV